MSKVLISQNRGGFYAKRTSRLRVLELCADFYSSAIRSALAAIVVFGSFDRVDAQGPVYQPVTDPYQSQPFDAQSYLPVELPTNQMQRRQFGSDGSRRPFNASVRFVGGDGLSFTQSLFEGAFPIYARMGDSGPDLVVLGSAKFGHGFFSGDTAVDLPSNLYTAGGGVRLVKPINPIWDFIGGVNVLYQGDGEAESDSVTVTGMGMFQWQRTEKTQWMFGVVATGVEDIPVIPVIGANWKPRDDWEVSFGLPQTRVAHRLSYLFPHQEVWGYAGLLGLGRGRYGVRRESGIDDVLTMREFPIAVGLERRGDGPIWFCEGGVAVGRQLEYEVSGEEIDLDAGGYVRLGLKF